MARGLIIILCMLLAGCDIFSPEACELILRPGVLLRMREADGGEVVTTSALAVAASGSYADSARFTSLLPASVPELRLAEERPGVYDIKVQTSGYEEWIADDIRVMKDGCSVRTEILEPILIPSGGD